MSFVKCLSLRDHQVAELAMRALNSLDLALGKPKTAHYGSEQLVIRELICVQPWATTTNCVGASAEGGVLGNAIKCGYDLPQDVRDEILANARRLATALGRAGTKVPGGIVLLNLWQEGGPYPPRVESVFAVNCSALDADSILDLPMRSGLRLS